MNKFKFEKAVLMIGLGICLAFSSEGLRYP